MLRNLHFNWLLSGLIGLGLALVPVTITSSGTIEESAACASGGCLMEANSSCYDGGKILLDYVNVID